MYLRDFSLNFLAIKKRNKIHQVYLQIFAAVVAAGLLNPSISAAKGFNAGLLYYPSDFVDKVQNHQLKDQDLRDEIFRVLSSGHLHAKNNNDALVPTCKGFSGNGQCVEHRSLGYDGARKVLFSQIYLKNEAGQYSLTDVYCERRYTDADFGGAPSIGPNLLPDGKVLNTEHTWPQSRFTGRFSTDMQKSDLHHLYPTDSKMNSRRSSLHFGEVVKEVEGLNCNTARLGHEVNNSQIVFEPPARHRGNVARSLFYFATRYQMKISPQEESALRKWNREDPVDEAEMLKNDQIQEAQGNRNPYIDFPQLVDGIDSFK